MKDLENKFEGYRCSIDIPNKRNFNPLNEAVEVVLTTKEGEKYSTNFATRIFLDYIFCKNRRTGECANGTYFSMPNLIIIEKISEENIRKTVDDMIRNRDIENYFKKRQ